MAWSMYVVKVKSTHFFDRSTIMESKKAPLTLASNRQDEVGKPDDKARE